MIRTSRLLAATVTLLFAACGSNGPAGNPGLGGTAAVGLPISGGTVILHCASAYNEATTTDDNGNWSYPVPADRLPCAVRVDGGTLGAGGAANGATLYGFSTTGSGVANLTPLSSLVMAHAVTAALGVTLEDMFATNLSATQLSQIQDNLAVAITQLGVALSGASYTLPANFNPMTAPFSARAGNPYDDLLESLAAGLQQSGQTYAQMLTSFAGGGALPAKPEEEQEPGEEEPGEEEPGEEEPGEEEPVAGAPIGKAAAVSFPETADRASDLALVVGEFDVAIYNAPSAADLGPAKLKVEYTPGDSFSMSLERSGVDYTRSTATVTQGCGGGICINLFDKLVADTRQELPGTGGGRRVSIYNYYEGGNSTGPGAYFSANFHADGSIIGLAGSYAFRNNISAYGAAVPAVFATLAGAFAGTAQQQLCNPNPVNVDITAQGSVRLQGKTSVSCTARDLTVTWDGLDDLIVPATHGATLILNASNIGGSKPGGGIYINLPNATTATGFSQVYSNFAGSEGDITSINATRP